MVGGGGAIPEGRLPFGSAAAMLAFARSEAAFLAAVATAAVAYTVGASWFEDLDDIPTSLLLISVLFVVMVWASFNVVRHADALAEILGEPYGTLILTLAVICIEVSVVAAIMLNGDPDPELARDTMFAVLMIVLNLVVGLALLIGGLRHGEQSFNLQGAQAFLAVLIPLSIISLVLPRFMSNTHDARFDAGEAVLFCGLTLVLYGTFLALQTGRHRGYFVDHAEERDHRGLHRPAEADHPGDRHGEGGGHKSIAYHALMLIGTLVPIVLLSEKFAAVADHVIDASGAPAALGGMLVAALVLCPEGFAALSAAAENRLQRAVNISLGSALSTIGLTVPAVLIIGLLTAHPVILGLTAPKIALLALTLLICSLTFGGVRTNVLQGLVHLALFVVYVVLIFD